MKAEKNLVVMNEREAADYLKINVGTLRNWRSALKGPPFVKMGGSVRYELSELEKFIKSSTKDPSDLAV